MLVGTRFYSKASTLRRRSKCSLRSKASLSVYGSILGATLGSLCKWEPRLSCWPFPLWLLSRSLIDWWFIRLCSAFGLRSLILNYNLIFQIHICHVSLLLDEFAFRKHLGDGILCLISLLGLFLECLKCLVERLMVPAWFHVCEKLLVERISCHGLKLIIGTQICLTWICISFRLAPYPTCR